MTDAKKQAAEAGELSDEQLDAVSGGTISDLGQKLQIALQEANNIYTRSSKLQSSVQKKDNDTVGAVIQKMG